MNKPFLLLIIAITLINITSNAQSYELNKKTQLSYNAQHLLTSVLNRQTDKVKARFTARNPAQTIEFFGIEPGMTVVETFPGNGGWYSKILLEYLGKQGDLIGADYAHDMWKKFDWMTEDRLIKNKTWVKDWTKTANSWRDEYSANVKAFQLGTMPNSFNGSADVVLFIRSLHNLALFEHNGSYLTIALQNAYQVLKPGGVVGIVQHIAPEFASNSWANGDNGYLKQSLVVQKLEAAGFEYLGASDVNINPKDKPSEKENVWRLPPSLATSRDKPSLKETYLSVGESSRMTLLFRKPL